MKCRKCGFPMKVEDITRAESSSNVHYACTNCGTCCTTHIKSRKQTEHWFIQTDDGMEYLKQETNKKEQI